MKRNSIGLLVTLFALAISGCTSAPKKKPRRTSSAEDSSESSLKSSGDSLSSNTSAPVSASSASSTTSDSDSSASSESSTTSSSSGSSTTSSSSGLSGSSGTSVVPPEPVPVDGVTVSPESLEKKVGDTPVQLVATVSPSNANNKNVTWESSKSTVASVSNSGYVQFVGEGSATITVETVDGGFTDTCTVTVSKATPPDPDDYYASISDSLTGNALLEALRSLNDSKKKSEVGYGSMGTTPSGQFKYTDYDPSTVQYDEKGQPYGTKIISFYSGNPMTKWNREHVWPNTHGGNRVENDIHMPRPTLESENGSRGHSFYIEGMKDREDGWDPAMEDFGREDYRGDSARIIFYCMVANNSLVLVDDKERSSLTKNNEMGVISDMLSWNLRYAVQDREQRRNSGAQYLQGNRNPFIDHPEYACKIWGGTNSNTKSICHM